MSFLNKEDRTTCWNHRDVYWNCLDQGKTEVECQEFRKKYEKFCPAQWVKHFDRKREYLKFKERLEKEGMNNEGRKQCASSASVQSFPQAVEKKVRSEESSL